MRNETDTSMLREALRKALSRIDALECELKSFKCKYQQDELYKKLSKHGQKIVRSLQ